MREGVRDVRRVLDAARVGRGVRFPVREHASEGVRARWHQAVLALHPPPQRLGRVGFASLRLQPLMLGRTRTAEHRVGSSPAARVCARLRRGGLAVARQGRLVSAAVRMHVPACAVVLEIRCPATELLERSECFGVLVAFVAGVGPGPPLLGVVPEDRNALIRSDRW